MQSASAFASAQNYNARGPQPNLDQKKTGFAFERNSWKNETLIKSPLPGVCDSKEQKCQNKPASQRNHVFWETESVFNKQNLTSSFFVTHHNPA